jgi:AraC-like DNA-binding protein
VARRIRTSAGGGILLAKFHLAGAAQFFAEPLDELSGATQPLDLLLPPSELDRLVTRIAEAPSHPLRVAILEQLLIARLRNGPPDAIVTAAARAIESSRGAIRIRALARALAISQDPLEKRFRRQVGSTPKQLASLVRLRAAIAACRTGVPLARVAHQAGYYDQSHFIRDFRALTGEPPGRFLRSGDYC